MKSLKQQIHWHVGMLVPGLLIGIGLLDAGLRLVPLERFAFRAWEQVLRGKAPTTAFKPNARCHVSHASGDLARMGNWSNLREDHDETFTTDGLGFRNAPEVLDSKPAAIVFGSSFSAGSGVTDSDTISAQLAKRLGRPVYNAAAPGGSCSFRLIQGLTKRLRPGGGVVILEILEREPIPQGPTDPILDGIDRWTSNPTTIAATQPQSLVPADLRTSRLEILARRFCRALRNGWLFPRNSQVVCRKLRNGEPMLFYAPHIDLSNHTQDVAPAIDHWVRLVRKLQNENITPILFLVPEKPSVYGPILREPIFRRDPSVLAKLECGLKARGIPVVNLEPVFLKQASEGYGQRQYIYRKDDTHWNPRGICLAADCIAPLVEAELQKQGDKQPL